MQVREVKITKVEMCKGKQLSDTFYKNCQFCEKLVQIHSNNFGSCLKIGGGKFYCPFCLRNNFHHKTGKNVLVYSFRSIIGYYYYKFYIEKTHGGYKRMWLTQIQDMISSHAVIGLASPVLTFDPQTYLWFADFNKIGNHKRKAPFKEVKSVVRASFDEFGIDRHMDVWSRDNFWEKFSKALDMFYEKRQRPKDKKMLVPTFCHQQHGENKMEFHDKTRNFIPQKLLLK